MTRVIINIYPATCGRVNEPACWPILFSPYRHVVIFFFLMTFLCGSLAGQEAFQRMQYPLDLTQLNSRTASFGSLRAVVSFREAGASGEAYREEFTDLFPQEGQVTLLLGAGKALVGEFSDIPWETGRILIQVSVFEAGQSEPLLVREERPWSVPYAFHARRAGEVVMDTMGDLRSSSIYWFTAGNTSSRPPYHYLGTNDEQDLLFKTNGEERMRIKADGRLQIRGGSCCTSGIQDQKRDYPVVVEAKNQGIAISINEGRSYDNNFVAFMDKNRFLGRIEGETLAEWRSSEPYENQTALFVLEGVSFGVQIAAEIVEATGKLPFHCSAASGAASFAIVAQYVVDLANFGLRVGDWQAQGRLTNGVNYNSGGADYAEHLPLAEGVDTLLPGQVVGIHQGKVSLDTEQAEAIRVVSTHPIILGNMTTGQDSLPTNRVPIAFMGQTKVRTVGEVEVGDYLLPSGQQDGLAIAVSPEDMQLGDYNRIIGVAWSSSRPRRLFNAINTAIGLRTNALAEQIEVLENKLNWVLQELHERENGKAMTTSTDSPMTEPPSSRTSLPVSGLPDFLDDKTFDAFVDAQAPVFNTVFSAMHEALIRQNVDLEAMPLLRELVSDPVATLKALHRNPRYQSGWSIIDQYIKKDSHD